MKKDKEYVTSGVPKLGQKQTSIAACSCKQDHNKMLQENRQYKEQEIESLKNHISQLKITHADEIEKVKREYQKVLFHRVHRGEPAICQGVVLIADEGLCGVRGCPK